MAEIEAADSFLQCMTNSHNIHITEEICVFQSQLLRLNLVINYGAPPALSGLTGYNGDAGSGFGAVEWWIALLSNLMTGLTD